MTQALILVDIQNDYFPGGAMELVGMTNASDNARTVLDSFRAGNTPLFHIQHLAARSDAAELQRSTFGGAPELVNAPGTRACEWHVVNPPTAARP